MPFTTIACARCAVPNHLVTRFCAGCGLPMGAAEPDAEAAAEALGPYEAPDPADPDTTRPARDLAARSGFEVTPAGPGWRMVVPLRLDRRQAVYIGPGGTDLEGRAVLGLVSVCGPASGRDATALLKLNARAVDGHFAIKVLRGEEYFVVVDNLLADLAPGVDAARLVRRIAEVADGLEERLTRGRDLY